MKNKLQIINKINKLRIESVKLWGLVRAEQQKGNPTAHIYAKAQKNAGMVLALSWVLK